MTVDGYLKSNTSIQYEYIGWVTYIMFSLVSLMEYECEYEGSSEQHPNESDHIECILPPGISSPFEHRLGGVIECVVIVHFLHPQVWSPSVGWLVSPKYRVQCGVKNIMWSAVGWRITCTHYETSLRIYFISGTKCKNSRIKLFINLLGNVYFLELDVPYIIFSCSC